MKFINREPELTALEGKWLTNKPQFFVLYGKRRVGKTELIKQFMKGKPGIYYLADKRTIKEQLIELSQLLGNYFNDQFLLQRPLTGWLEVFLYLKEKVTEPFVLAIDEYPYLVETDKAMSSIFQKGWDEYLKKTKIFLILSGSSVAMMESEALLYKSPLYGRRTGQMLLIPLSFYQSWQFFPKKSFAEFLSIYSLTGGLPAYLEQIDPSASLLENIRNKVFPKTAFLHNEIEFILKGELREPKNYLAILRALSLGKHKFGEIVNATGLEKNVMHKYLSTLERLQLIERLVSVTDKNPLKSKRPLYKVSDNFTRFWFQYIYPYKSDLEIGNHNIVERQLKQNFNLLESLVYEQVCQEILLGLSGKIFRFEKAGKWWLREKEIDVIGVNSATREIVFGECKWSSKAVGTNVYEQLKQVSTQVDWFQNQRREFYVLFSKSGFTDNMKKLAQEEEVFLIEQDKLIFH